MKNKGAHFDAVYIANKNNEKCSYVLYDQIYKDFRIKRSEVKLKVLAISTINLESEEIRNNQKENLIFNYNNFDKFKMFNDSNWKGIPVPSNDFKDVPLTIFFQNPFMNNNLSSSSMK